MITLVQLENSQIQLQTHNLQTVSIAKLDMLAVLPHKLPWAEKIYARSTTKQLAFSAHIPLLVITGMNNIQIIKSDAL